jgi:hypothetical protein
MLHRKNFKPVLLLIAAGCFTSAISNAQLTVLPNGNVGIGTPVPIQKLEVLLNAADPAQESGRFTNNGITALTKYGIRNTVSNAGTGSRYGILNDVQQLSTSTALSYGISNTVTAGASGGYGIYNINNSGGNGFRYGLLNQVFQASATGNMALGMYNYTSNTVGYTYGIYNYNYTSGASTFTNYGQFNYQYSAGTSTHYGIYNYVTPLNATTAGTRYGIWTEAANTGTGIKYGIYARGLGVPNYAGYFDGNVFVNGAFGTASDDGIKTNVSPIVNAVRIIDGLNPKKFDFRKDIPGMTFPEGPQLGIMASDVEKDLPELVKKVTTPLNNPSVTKPGDGQGKETSSQIVPTGQESYFTFRSVNYIGLIPVLVQAVKDQQRMIEQLQLQLKEQKALITRLQPAAK